MHCALTFHNLRRLAFDLRQNRSPFTFDLRLTFTIEAASERMNMSPPALYRYFRAGVRGSDEQTHF